MTSSTVDAARTLILLPRPPLVPRPLLLIQLVIFTLTAVNKVGCCLSLSRLARVCRVHLSSGGGLTVDSEGVTVQLGSEQVRWSYQAEEYHELLNLRESGPASNVGDSIRMADA